MTNDDGRKPEGAPERSPKAGAGAPSGVEGNGPKRFSVRRKLAVVARLLRGEPLELVARETNVSVAKLTEWRDRALSGAATALKERERDDRDDEIDALALRCSLLWSGACCACVEYLARQRLSRSQRDAEHAIASPWSGRRLFGRRIGRSDPPSNSRLPAARRRLPQVMGAIALCWGSREPPPCATGDAGERLARAASRWTHRDQAARWNDHHRQ